MIDGWGRGLRLPPSRVPFWQCVFHQLPLHTQFSWIGYAVDTRTFLPLASQYSTHTLPHVVLIFSGKSCWTACIVPFNTFALFDSCNDVTRFSRVTIRGYYPPPLWTRWNTMVSTRSPRSIYFFMKSMSSASQCSEVSPSGSSIPVNIKLVRLDHASKSINRTSCFENRSPIIPIWVLSSSMKSQTPFSF